MPDVNTLLDMAIKEADNLFDGEEFLVKDLFKGILPHQINYLLL